MKFYSFKKISVLIVKMSDLLRNIYKRPKRDKGDEMPKFQEFKPNVVHQMDILYLPTDPNTGDKYLLVVIDVADRKVDAEPLKKRDADSVAKALAKIYRRGILKTPLRVQVDSGSEFKGKMLKFFKDKGIVVRVALVGRHRQQAVVERANKTIGDALFKKMTAMELITGEENREWADEVKDVINAINERAKKRKKVNPKKIDYIIDKKQKLLPLGTKVRVALDVPRDNINEKRLHGNFRSADVRWDFRNPRIIMHIAVKPGYPPLYYVSKAKKEDEDYEIEKVGRTRNQLQVIDEDEEYPDAEKLLKGRVLDKYVVQKIIGDKIVKRKLYLKIKWAGYPESQATWEPADVIKEDVPEKFREYFKKKGINV